MLYPFPAHQEEEKLLEKLMVKLIFFQNSCPARSIDRKRVNGIIHNHVWYVPHGRHRLLACTRSGIFFFFLFSISFPQASSSIGEPDLTRQGELCFK